MLSFEKHLKFLVDGINIWIPWVVFVQNDIEGTTFESPHFEFLLLAVFWRQTLVLKELQHASKLFPGIVQTLSGWFVLLPFLYASSFFEFLDFFILVRSFELFLDVFFWLFLDSQRLWAFKYFMFELGLETLLNKIRKVKFYHIDWAVPLLNFEFLLFFGHPIVYWIVFLAIGCFTKVKPFWESWVSFPKTVKFLVRFLHLLLFWRVWWDLFSVFDSFAMFTSIPLIRLAGKLNIFEVLLLFVLFLGFESKFQNYIKLIHSYNF